MKVCECGHGEEWHDPDCWIGWYEDLDKKLCPCKEFKEKKKVIVQGELFGGEQ